LSGGKFFSFFFFFFFFFLFSFFFSLSLFFVSNRCFLGDPEIEQKLMENPDALEKGSVDEVLDAVGHARPGWLKRKNKAKGGKK
jgi:hypothetical protein